ncbi:hypothetical protein C0Q70_13218 [Pomacea canaliculata]|uniref:CUB domain-containing protein n=1 Tax=Pomacea canaliculata TaxID=400727 RepID=A0A2T7NWN3_POMCA|nr:hypothetical protein C0Q70_13218 [Pomacea canaliculata]
MEVVRLLHARARQATMAEYHEVSVGIPYKMQTPEYPNNYSNNALYRWQLEVKDAAYVIHVVFTTIDIEQCSGSICNCDYLELFDGPSEMSSRIVRLCSSSPMMSDLYSSGSSLYIKFVSDASRTGTGFTLTYSAVHRQSGYPDNYPPNSNCQWRISADQGNVIHLFVHEVSMENCNTCTCDKVVMYDGPSSSASELYRMCTTIQPNYSVYSTGQDMFITFTSDFNGSGRGFVLEYWAVPDRTERTCAFYLGASASETKTIYSPGYPMNYSNNAECSWQVRADAGYVVQLSVLNVDMEQCTTCSCDKLQIFDASDYLYGRRIRQYCGSLHFDVVYTTQQYAFLTFTSDSSKTGKGFVITYRAVTYDPEFYKTTVGSPTYSQDQTTILVMIVVGSLTGMSILVIFVVFIFFLVKRRQARLLNTYSNLPHTGNTVTVTSTTVPPMHYYQPNIGVVVSVPGVVYPAQSAPPAFMNEAFTPDLIPTSNQQASDFSQHNRISMFIQQGDTRRDKQCSSAATSFLRRREEEKLSTKRQCYF